MMLAAISLTIAVALSGAHSALLAGTSRTPLFVVPTRAAHGTVPAPAPATIDPQSGAAGRVQTATTGHLRGFATSGGGIGAGKGDGKH